MGAGHARQDALHGRGWCPELREMQCMAMLSVVDVRSKALLPYRLVLTFPPPCMF